jgi:hypothetical protein
LRLGSVRPAIAALPAVESGLNAEALTALGATGANHGTATPGAHANQETMCALAANDRRLICAFHDLALSRETRDYSGVPAICQGQFSLGLVDNSFRTR